MVLPSRRLVTSPALPEHREVLAHVRDLAAHAVAQVADRELADGERLQHAQALGVGQRAPDRGRALSIGSADGR